MLRKDPFVTGEYYHIYNRGIDKRIIFKSKFDFERFIMLLYVANSTESFRLDQLINYQHKTFPEILSVDRGRKLVSIGAWCLMSNHFHLIIKQEVDGGITKFMKKLGTGYSMYFNIKYERAGALFGGLFKAKLIGSNDNYLRHLFGYIHLNPLDIRFPDWKKSLKKPSHNMKDFLGIYNYSSYLDYANYAKAKRAESGILSPETFPDYFDKKHTMQDFVENYFMDED